MYRFSKSVFTDLGIWMAGFGSIIGLIFPFAVYKMGVPREYVVNVPFHLYCITAGIIVGVSNFILARMVVGSRLRELAGRLRHVSEILREVKESAEPPACRPEQCHLPADSDDELGEAGRSFNFMIDTLDRALSRTRSIGSFTQMLVSQLNLDELARRALSELIAASASDAGALLAVREGTLHLLAAENLEEAQQLASHPAVERALERDAGRRIQFPEGIRLDGVLARFTPREAWLKPIRYRGTPVGLVVLAASRPYQTEEIRYLELLERPLALALYNALSFERLERLAALDALTGCYNRRFGLGRLREEYERAIRSEQPLGLILFDIDHFKSINDTYGHLAGDRVLAHTARVARTIIRKGDLMVRYGGEEFLVALPSASMADALEIAERIRRAVEETVFEDGSRQIRTTISAGVVSCPECPVESELELIARADAALYASKEAGRNCVTPSRGRMGRWRADLREEASAEAAVAVEALRHGSSNHSD